MFFCNATPKISQCFVMYKKKYKRSGHADKTKKVYVNILHYTVVFIDIPALIPIANNFVKVVFLFVSLIFAE